MKKGQYGAVTTVITAKKGVLKSDKSTNLLQLDLLDGNYYEDLQPKKPEDRLKYPFAKSSFKKYTLTIDLAKINGASDEGSDIMNTYNMLNMSELKYTLDSLQLTFNKDIVSYSESIDKTIESLYTVYDFPVVASALVIKPSKATDDLIALLPEVRKVQVFDLAKNSINNTIFTLDSYTTDLEFKQNNINDHWIGYYDKILIAYSCMLMFFIGAPLGAIIKKGGLGLPLVFAVLIFIIYNFANTFGKKLAGQDAIHPFIGVAAGALLLTPFAILLTYRATNDMGLTIDLDWLIVPIKKFLNKRNTNSLVSENITTDES
jgi:lipopolysaccharide export system permease protein